MWSWINYAGAILLILLGIFLYTRDPAFSTPGTPTALIIVGLVWGGLAFPEEDRTELERSDGDNRRLRLETSSPEQAPDPARTVRGMNYPVRRRRYRRRSQDGLLGSVPGYSRHRGSQPAAARLLAAAARPLPGGYLFRRRGADGETGSVAMSAPATVAGGSLVKDSLRIAINEVKEDRYGVKGSVWVVISAIVLGLTSSELLLTDREPSLLEQSEMLYIVTSLAISLGLLVAGILAADSVVGQKERAALGAVVLVPTKCGALLLGKVLSVMVAWLLIFVTCVPYIMVVGSGTRVSWAALIYTFVLGTLCVLGFATLTVGVGTLSRSERGVRLASLAIFIAMVPPTLLGAALHKSRFETIYNVLSPFAHARLSLESVILDKESLLVQLPYIGALAVFAVIAGVFAGCGVSLERDE
jgi:hypothetical protein